MGEIIEVIERYELPDFPDIELPEEDGVPLESDWHRIQINLLVDVVKTRWRDRNDFFAGGNMFIYYSLEQAKTRQFKGPDFFVVKNIPSGHSRGKWVLWEENGRYPDVIVELLSPSTAAVDLGDKKRIYEQVFRTPDYFCYDPDTQQLLGWHLRDAHYEALQPDGAGRLWCASLEAWLGTWQGEYLDVDALWLRLYDEDGRLIPTEAEAERLRAEAAENRAVAERQRAEAAEAELARLRTELERLRNR